MAGDLWRHVDAYHARAYAVEAERTEKAIESLNAGWRLRGQCGGKWIATHWSGRQLSAETSLALIRKVREECGDLQPNAPRQGVLL